MMEIIGLLALVTVPLYWAWRAQIATNSRVELLSEVDDFLNPEKGNSEIAMDTVYNAYEYSKNHFFIVAILFQAIFKIKLESFNISNDELKNLPEKEYKKMLGLITKLVFTNIKLSPVTYFITGLIFLLFTLVIALLNHLSPKKIMKYTESLKERILYSLYSF